MHCIFYASRNRILLLAFASFLLSAVLRAQTLSVTDAVTAPYTPENLVSNVFLGNGVEVTGITFGGVPTAVGYFSGGTSVIGIERGIVMTTGRAESGASGPGCTENGIVQSSVSNNSTAVASELASLLKDPSLSFNDVVFYEIKFIPTADTLRFRYCFASEEYPEYSCSAYNDVFGFFIQGPGYSSPTNIALIPGVKLPVSIENLHPGEPNDPNCAPLNAQFFNDNNGSAKQPVYDGYTDVFVAEAIVVPCQEYVIRLAIADVTDAIYDSGVFLEAKSFGTGSLRVKINTPSVEGSLAEGCSAGSIVFTLPNIPDQDYLIDYKLGGTAQNGVDYEKFPTNLIIPAGQQEITVPLTVFEDNLVEGEETLTLDVQRDPCNRDTIAVYLRDNPLKAPNLRPDTSICVNSAPLALDATLPIALPQPPSFSNSQTYTIPEDNKSVSAPITVSGVLPATLAPGMIRSVCVNVDHSWIDDVELFLVSPNGQIIKLVDDIGKDGDNYVSTCFTPSATEVIGSAGTAPPFTGEWQPLGVWSDLWDGAFPANGEWRLVAKDDAAGIEGKLVNWSITFEPAYKVDYLWTPALGLSCTTCPLTQATPVQNTLYKVKATDSYGCTLQDSVKIELLPSLPVPAVTCDTTNLTSATFTWPAVQGALSYEVNVEGTGWVPASGMLSHTVNGLSGIWSVGIEVRGVNSLLPCPAQIGQASCSNCKQPVLTSIVKDISCAGLSNGSITIKTDSLNPPYSFKLNTQTNSTGIFTGLAPGNYLLSVADNAGCFDTLQLSIKEPKPLAVAAKIQTSIPCFGDSIGVIEALPTGGTLPYTYLWNDPAAQTTPVISNLKAGIYQITVTDAGSCTAATQITLAQQQNLTVNTLANNPTCADKADGSVATAVNGGKTPYKYVWSTGSSNNFLTGLTAGLYDVTVTDANGCSISSGALLNAPDTILTTPQGGIVNCFGGADGSAEVKVSGGVIPYTYKWSDPKNQTGPVALNLKSDKYTVTVTDGNGCTATETVNVASPLPLDLQLTTLPASCFESTDGTAVVRVKGGTAPYKYAWNDPLLQTVDSLTNLASGAYSVTVTDQNQCADTAVVNVAQPPAVVLTATITDITCSGDSTGGIAMNVQFAQTPYSFVWSTGDTGQTIAGKPKGTYSVSMTDARGCTASWMGEIAELNPITAIIEADSVRCFGDSSGRVALTISGGQAPYAIQWQGTNGFTGSGAVISNLAGGFYNATLTDANNCFIALTAEVGTPAIFLESGLPEIADTVCFGAPIGSARANPSGGTAPYSFKWSDGSSTGPLSTDLPSARYVYLTITDSRQCKVIDSTIIIPKGEVFAFLEGVEPSCNNGTDGKASVKAMFYSAIPANLADFTYSWNTTPPQTGLQATGLKSGQTYTLTASDPDGCTSTQTIMLENPPLLTARVDSVLNVNCFGFTDGRLKAAGQGGQPPYTYEWSNGLNGVEIFNLSAGTYKLSVTDSKGCIATTSASIKQPAELKANPGADPVPCYGDATGRTFAQPTGGIQPYSFLWSSGSKTAEAQNLVAGFYTLVLTDKNGCTRVDSIQVKQPENPVSGQATARDVRCFGGRDGQVIIKANGGTPPYRYALDKNAWNGSTVQIGLKAGTYVPKIIDKNSCVLNLPPIEVEQRSALEVDLGPDFAITLGQDTQLQAVVINAAGKVQYQWAAEDSIWLSCLNCKNPFVDSLLFLNRFQVTATDSLGCSATDEITITVEKPRRIFVPTGFSPNADDANDLLLVHGQPSARVLSFQIYDRWGEMVYETLDFQVGSTDVGWNGEFRGKPMDPGVYIWVLEVKYLDGVTEVLKGNVTLIR